jgi:hypothetical protein
MTNELSVPEQIERQLICIAASTYVDLRNQLYGDCAWVVRRLPDGRLIKTHIASRLERMRADYVLEKYKANG